MKATLLTIMLLWIHAVSAQQNESVTISGLPKKLLWENQPVDFAVKGNSLRVTAGAKTDMYRDPRGEYNADNAPRLMFTADQDFVLTARIEHDFANKWDAGALVIRTDSLNWVKFAFEKDYTGAKRVVSVVTKNHSDDCNSAALFSSYVYYKIARSGSSVLLYYSENKTSWYLVRNFVFQSPGPLKVGFLAQSPDGKGSTVQFSEISYELKRIADPFSPQ